MSIASSTTKDRAPFGGAECYWMNTGQLEFRPSERRRRVGVIPLYKHSTLRGCHLAMLSSLVYLTTQKPA